MQYFGICIEQDDWYKLYLFLNRKSTYLAECECFLFVHFCLFYCLETILNFDPLKEKKIRPLNIYRIVASDLLS